jgi:hypothetical protein
MNGIDDGVRSFGSCFLIHAHLCTSFLSQTMVLRLCLTRVATFALSTFLIALALLVCINHFILLSLWLIIMSHVLNPSSRGLFLMNSSDRSFLYDPSRLLSLRVLVAVGCDDLTDRAVLHLVGPLASPSCFLHFALFALSIAASQSMLSKNQMSNPYLNQ